MDRALLPALLVSLTIIEASAHVTAPLQSPVTIDIAGPVVVGFYRPPEDGEWWTCSGLGDATSARRQGGAMRERLLTRRRSQSIWLAVMTLIVVLASCERRGAFYSSP